MIWTIQFALRGVGSALLLAGLAIAQGTGSISGRVVSEQGVLLQAKVTLTFASARGYPAPPRRVSTGADGSFSFSRLAAGSYALCAQVSAAEAAPANSPYVDTCVWGSGQAPIAVAAGQQVGGIVFTAVKGAWLQVHVADPDGVLPPVPIGGPAQYEPQLQLILNGPDKLYRHARFVSTDVTGRNYQIAVPLKTALTLNVASTVANVFDQNGNQLPQNNATGFQPAAPTELGPMAFTTAQEVKGGGSSEDLPRAGGSAGSSLVFSSSTATPGGGQTNSVSFTLSTQVTTFQVTSVTGSGIVQNTGQEVQITQSVPANNAPTYTTCSTADPNVTCQVISSAPGTVMLGVTASTSAVHGNRVLQLNGGAGTGHLTVADWEGVDTLTSIVPSTIQAGQSEPATIYGSMLDPDCEEDEDCASPTLMIEGPGNLTGYVTGETTSSLSVELYADPYSVGNYGVAVDLCGGYYNPDDWLCQDGPVGFTVTPAAGQATCSLTIGSPANGQVFSLSSGYNSATLPLGASSNCAGTSATWVLQFSYVTTGGTTFQSQDVSTTSTLGQTTNWQSPVGLGGLGNPTATASVAGATAPVASVVLAYIDGTTIPTSTIIAQLRSLYAGGATPDLLADIAMQESSYSQFVSRTLYGTAGLWPNESPNPALGQYVGLMQVPNAMGVAFDWVQNTQAGASVFQQWLSYAQGVVSAQQASCPGLVAPTGQQLENDALTYYGGFGAPYYVPNSGCTGWIQNPNNSGGINYANQVRGQNQ